VIAERDRSRSSVTSYDKYDYKITVDDDTHDSHWNEFGQIGMASPTRSLDDYHFALHTLGKHAARGYMHVMVTDGKGVNVEVKKSSEGGVD